MTAWQSNKNGQTPLNWKSRKRRTQFYVLIAYIITICFLSTLTATSYFRDTNSYSGIYVENERSIVYEDTVRIPEVSKEDIKALLDSALLYETLKPVAYQLRIHNNQMKAMLENFTNQMRLKTLIFQEEKREIIKLSDIQAKENYKRGFKVGAICAIFLSIIVFSIIISLRK